MQWLQNNESPETGPEVAASTFFGVFTPIAAFEYAPGVDTTCSVISATDGHHSLMPASWTIPPKVGDCVPSIRFVFALPGGGGMILGRSNETGAPITETMAELIASFTGTNHGTITDLYLSVRNTSLGPQTETVGEFEFMGFQV